MWTSTIVFSLSCADFRSESRNNLFTSDSVLVVCLADSKRDQTVLATTSVFPRLLYSKAYYLINHAGSSSFAFHVAVNVKSRALRECPKNGKDCQH